MTHKPINKLEKTFYVFEISPTYFTIFDSMIDIPVYCGSWAIVAPLIANLKKSVKQLNLLFYSKDESTGKLKYEPSWSYKDKRK